MSRCEKSIGDGKRCGCEAEYELRFVDGSGIKLCEKHAARLMIDRAWAAAVDEVYDLKRGGLAE